MTRFTLGSILAMSLAAAAGGCCAMPSLSDAQEAYEAGDYDRAIDISTWSIDTYSGSYRAFLIRGKAYQKKGDFAKAITDFDRARQLDSSCGEPAIRQAQCYLATGRVADSEAILVAAMKNEYPHWSVRDQMLTHAMYGEVRLTAGNYPAAVDSLTEAIKVSKASRPLEAEGATGVIYYNMSRAQFEQHAYRKAREAFQGYLDRQKTAGIEPDAQDLYTLAVLHFLCEDIGAARKLSPALPQEYKVRLDEILGGDTFSVRALYETKQKQSQESNPQ